MYPLEFLKVYFSDIGVEALTKLGDHERCPFNLALDRLPYYPLDALKWMLTQIPLKKRCKEQYVFETLSDCNLEIAKLLLCDIKPGKHCTMEMYAYNMTGIVQHNKAHGEEILIYMWGKLTPEQKLYRMEFLGKAHTMFYVLVRTPFICLDTYKAILKDVPPIFGTEYNKSTGKYKSLSTTHLVHTINKFIVEWMLGNEEKEGYDIMETATPLTHLTLEQQWQMVRPHIKTDSLENLACLGMMLLNYDFYAPRILNAYYEERAFDYDNGMIFLVAQSDEVRRKRIAMSVINRQSRNIDTVFQASAGYNIPEMKSYLKQLCSIMPKDEIKMCPIDDSFYIECMLNKKFPPPFFSIKRRVATWIKAAEKCKGNDEWEMAAQCWWYALKTDIKEATKQFEENGYNLGMWCHCVHALQEQKEYETALVVANVGILSHQHTTDRFVLFHAKGKMYRAMKYPTEARNDFHRAVVLNNKLIASIFECGVTANTMKCYREAVASLDEVIRLDPKHELARRALINLVTKARNFETLKKGRYSYLFEDEESNKNEDAEKES
eukprot:TRINITY_DN2872_c0_g1_i1.p1 TRINITY_DN2872_c0_g1~~TRINITY_DN2872_c0_g1_i1.p1  ORF type:complete len:566 (+),score=175.29 TRINITY_DN2872_c0_g1_i1:46-1698(+)